MKIRILYLDPETQEEVEINQDYLDKKFESRVEFANSKAFEEVSYQFLLFYMIFFWKISTARTLLHTS